MTQFYAIRSMLKANATQQSGNAADWNEHLSQERPRVKLLGRLYDEGRHMVGLLGIVEADDLAQARHFLDTSPMHASYDVLTIEMVEFEVGHV